MLPDGVLIMKVYLFSISFFIFFLSSCAQERFYNSQQKNLKQECEKLTSPQHEACLSDLDNTSYDEYRRERERLLKEEVLEEKLLR